MKKQSLKIAVTAFLLSCCTMHLSAQQETVSKVGESAIENSNSGHFIYANVGYSHIMSHVEYSWTSGEIRLGMTWQAGYEWIFEKNYGVGFMYDGYVSKGSTIVGIDAAIDESFAMHYFAPQFAGIIRLKNDKWTLHYGFGIGLSMIADGIKGKGKAFDKNNVAGKNYDYGVGINGKFGVEYKITPRLGVTADLSLIESIIQQQFIDVEMPVDRKREINGASRISLNIGLKFKL